MFDGRSGATIANAVVLVQGSKILSAGAALPVPAGATVIDLGDATLLPGFIDSHTHMTGEGQLRPDFFDVAAASDRSGLTSGLRAPDAQASF
jgi:imidazolonepropionase-like amidohydrolase